MGTMLNGQSRKELIAWLQASGVRKPPTLEDYADNFFNMFGLPLHPDILARLRRLIDEPSSKTWDNAYSLLLQPNLTLWQAVLAVDPTFPKVGPVSGPIPRTRPNKANEMLCTLCFESLAPGSGRTGRNPLTRQTWTLCLLCMDEERLTKESRGWPQIPTQAVVFKALEYAAGQRKRN